jgi:hypothetical protein
MTGWGPRRIKKIINAFIENQLVMPFFGVGDYGFPYLFFNKQEKSVSFFCFVMKAVKIAARIRISIMGIILNFSGE